MGITIKDIAKQANVSLSTVSRVINDSGYVSKATRKKVERVIKQHDYVPSALATQLSKGSNNVIGVLIPEIDNPFFSGVIKGINEVADSEGLSVILCDSNENPDKEQRIVRTLKEQRIRGLLITSALGAHKQTAAYTGIFSQFDIPIVLIDREIIGTDYDGVFFDDERAIFDVTSLLIQNGHTHIEMLAGNPELPLGQNRVLGYRKAFQSNGLKPDEKWIHYSLFTKEDGYRVMCEIIGRDRPQWPTAVVTNNNMLTLGALKAIFEHKLSIPEDIAFVGYDQIETLEILKVDITLAEKDTVEMGRVAMSMLCERMNQNPAVSTSSRKIIMMPKVMVRGSEKLVR